MSGLSRQLLTPDRLIRLHELSADELELLLLGFLRSRPLLTVSRGGKAVSARVAEATTYARSGRDQAGIDVQAKMEGGETWVFQCKRVKSWNRSQTEKAIAEATFAANHYVLVLACNPPHDVHDEIAKHANWTLWNLDTTCKEIQLRTPPEILPRILGPILSADELKRFTPFASTALVTREQFFADRMGMQRLFRHDWDLVGRGTELARLETLMKPGGRRGAIIYSKGGDGKSRLLLEFARTAESAGARVLFLNPNGSTDALDFSFLRDDEQFVIVVDDAHRPDTRHVPLLRLAEQDKRVRLLFATRPQGFHPLLSRLIETGLREEFDEFALPPLRTPEIRKLAEQALGAKQQGFAGDLTQFTKDSAFLTVLAGELIRLGRLSLGGWASEDDFRLRVFKAFEEENLRDLSRGQAKLAARLLRVIALLAPLNLDDCFSEKAAASLAASALDVSDEIQRLRRIQLLTESRADARIIPDLFADFLAYDVAVDLQRRQLPLLNAVRCAFPEAASAMLRNLAEAAWVGGPPTSDVDVMLAPLVEAEFQRFRGLSFYYRAEFLSAWGGYGVYVPRQTIELATIALCEKTAPEQQPDFREIFPVPQQMNCHRYMIEKLAALIEPVALYHENYRDAALDLLWEIGKLKPLKRFMNLGPHAWETIGKVLKPQEGKPVPVCLAGLDWLARKLTNPVERAQVSENFGLLDSLLGGCFTRFVEFRRQRGMTFSWWEQPVHQTNTAGIRQRAIAILASIIEQADWRAAIGVLRVLDDVMRPIVKQQRWVGDSDAFRGDWRGDRLAGLESLRAVVSRHPEPVIRYFARTQLLRLICYEEDPVFREACRATAAAIPDDLALRMSRALLAQGHFEEGDDDELPEGSAGMEEARKRWEVTRDEIFEEFCRAHSGPGEMFAAFVELDAHLRAADCHPSVWWFFGYLARHDPATATSIATRLVESAPTSPLARAWPALIENSTRGTAPLVALERRALAQPGTEAACAAITFLIDRHDQEPALTAEERALVLEIASRAQGNEIQIFLRVLEFRGPNDESLTREIITRLPLDASPDADAASVLRILAAHCAQDGSDAALVRTLLGKLTALPEFDLSHDPDAWHLLTTQYPRELLDFLRARVEFEVSGHPPKEFRALSTFRQVWLDSAKLQTAADFEQLRADVWEKVIANDEHSYRWLQLFQSFGLSDTAWLQARLLAEIDAATTIERLHWVTRFLAFRGSLMVLRQPDLTRRFLARARELAGYEEIRAALYCATGPQTTSWTNGELKEEDDYVEAEALKAAELHANDPELHPFFRWIVECEQSQKRRERTEHELRMRELEE